MNHKHYPIELLAPARTAESGIIAIKYGADAVYAGAPRYGARASVGNEPADFEKLITYAHKYRAKVYCALNTILNDEELEDAVSIVKNLYNMGIDGIIIQDMGFLEADLPPVKLIASTQTNNADPEKVKFLEDVGFTRVILARELSLHQIREIRNKTTTELECFVHGAICVGYSGQCYMSYAIGGRSGNRGVCAQPCREAYSLTDGDGKTISKNKYFLSLKDLCFENKIEDLIDAGITSFKIEGRLKDDNYVKNITAFYRQKLDSVIEQKGLRKASSGKVYSDFTPDPAKSFNRGFTEYFLDGRGKNISSTDTPKSKGEYIGKVGSVENGFLVIETDKLMTAGDGICFNRESGEFSGTVINFVDKNNIKVQDPTGIRKGTVLFRNFDKDFCDRLERSRTERKIGLNFRLDKTGGGFLISAADEDGFQVESDFPESGETAKNPEKYREILSQSLAKLGDSIFRCCEVTVNTDALPFHPVSVINGIRRNLTDRLEKKRLEEYTPETLKMEKNSVPYPSSSLDYRGNVMNRQALEFYRRHGVKNISPAAETNQKMDGRVVMKTRYCIKKELGLCGGALKKGEEQAPLFLTDRKSRQFRVEFTCGQCGQCGMEIFG
ncbi:MAG: U32 family peptidase [Firmicutes bacterium]|nr:U32 family peptidase [Bacillota bacterium]